MAVDTEILDKDLDTAELDDGPGVEDFEEPEDQDESHEPEETEASSTPAPALAAAQGDIEARLRKVDQNISGWESEIQKREAALEAARETRAKAETDFANGAIEDAKVKIAAEDAYHEAREALLEARRSREQWVKYGEEERRMATPEAVAAQAWMKANPRFESDAAFRDEANRVFNELTNEARDPRKPEFFAELDRRLRSKKPMTNRAKSSGAPVSRERATPRADNPSSKGPSEKEAKWMRDFGLDPNNAKHVKRWQNEKRVMVSEAA